MRHLYDMPQDDGLRRSTRCPPAHPSMASPSHHVQASAQMARLSGPLMRSPALMGKVSPIFNQRGSTKNSPPTTSTMGGEYSPAAAPPMPSAQASPFDCLVKGWMAPSPARHGAAMPSRPPCHDQRMGGRQLPSAPTMVGNLTRQTHKSARLASGIHFYGPACGAAPIDTTMLANLESTSREIAVVISKRRPIPNKWVIAHLAIHLDHIAKGPMRTQGHCLAFRQGIPMAGVFKVPDGNLPLQTLLLPM
jgi:hypothetical protein